MGILDLPAGDRPRERLLRLGAETLSDRELLALLLGSGRGKCDAIELAKEVIKDVEDLRTLAVADPAALQLLSGIGPAKATRIAAAFELGRRARNKAETQRITGSQTVAEAAAPLLRGLSRERTVVIVCTTGGSIRRVTALTDGAADHSLFPIRDVLNLVLSTGGTAFAVAHNHPSGLLTPSESDLVTTAGLRAAAEVVGLRFLDHVILTETSWAKIP